MTMVRRKPNSPANQPPLRSGLAPGAAGPQTVLGYSEAPVSWAGRKTAHFAGAFAKRLKGFEPSTFCMASRRSSQLSYSRARASV
jgi:hypothetical protein